jgi:signal transduction histidine kinase
MPLSDSSALEFLLANLIHDLRQPLSNIESATYHLGSLTGSCEARVKDHMRVIERQVEQAESLLAAAVGEMARLRTQRQGEAMSIESTNFTRAGVT